MAVRGRDDLNGGDGVRRIRVMRIIARMNVGGPALQVTGLERSLDPTRFETRLLVGSVEEGEADYLQLRAPDIQAQRVPGLGRSVRTMGDARALRWIVGAMKGFRPDVVHTHTAKAGVLGRIAARIAGVPATVHTFHGHLLHGYFGRSGTAVVRSTERVLARRTTVLAAVGSKVRDELLAAGIGRPEQFVVVPPGVEAPEEIPRAEARRILELPLDVPVVVFVARLAPVKRVDRALAAFASVLESLPDARLLIVGEGPSLAEARRSAAPMMASVGFLGWRGDVGLVYSAADIALLTSDNEGMPVALIEAAMSGVPAVATPVGSVTEVVLDGITGRVVPADPRELAGAMKTLLTSDESLRRLGSQARAHAREKFGTSRLVADMERIYASVTEGVL